MQLSYPGLGGRLSGDIDSGAGQHTSVIVENSHYGCGGGAGGRARGRGGSDRTPPGSSSGSEPGSGGEGGAEPAWRGGPDPGLACLQRGHGEFGKRKLFRCDQHGCDKKYTKLSHLKVNSSLK